MTDEQKSREAKNKSEVRINGNKAKGKHTMKGKTKKYANQLPPAQKVGHATTAQYFL